MRRFRKTDLAAILMGAALLAGAVMAPAWLRARERARAISCVCRLKQIGTGFRLWANDRNAYPQTLSTNAGGVREFILRGETFRGFQVLSNELGLKTLKCPSDSRQPAKDFANLSNRSLSYFIGLNADESYPQMLLAGDRNIMTEPPGTNHILVLSPDRRIRVSQELHRGRINVGLMDGSAQQILDVAALASPGLTNVIALPE